MARLKTAYRPKSEATELNSAEDSNTEIPADYLLPDEDTLHREPGTPPEPQASQPEVPPPESDASRALLAQIAALQRSEEIQRQRQVQAAAEQRRVDWLQSTPAAQQNYAALGALHQEALQAGLDDLSSGYFQYMESGLEGLEQSQSDGEPMNDVRQPAAASAAQPTPEFFQPRPVKMPAPHRVQVSAPVSRSVPTAERRDREANPNSVKLSPSQREAARIAGISELEYARGVIAIEREQREGKRQP